MSPLDRCILNVDRNVPGAISFKPEGDAKFIDMVADPVRPYAFVDFVVSTGAVTSGVTGTMPMPAPTQGILPGERGVKVYCEKVVLAMGANGGVGVAIKLGLPGKLGKAVEKLGMAPTKPFEVAINIWISRPIEVYKNGVNCLGAK
jgi:hypothetical protein